MHRVTVISHRIIFFLILIFGAVKFSSAQTQVVFADSSKVTITDIYNDGFRTPTNILSFGAGGLFHARLFGDWYLHKNDIAEVNLVTTYDDEDKFGYYEEINYARYLLTFSKEKHLDVPLGSSMYKRYYIKTPVVRKIKIAPRLSTSIGYWHPNANKKGSLNPYQIGIGAEMSISRYAELNSGSLGLARETRIFMLMTDCPLLLGATNGTFGKVDIVNYDTLGGHTNALGFRFGIEYRNFSNFRQSKRTGGYTVYLIIEKNNFFAFGNSNGNYDGSSQYFQRNYVPTLTDRLKTNLSIMIGFAYSFMKKVKPVSTDQIK